MTSRRLARDPAGSLPDGRRPPVLREATGIVHLGLGAFARAHLATYTEEAAALDRRDRWGAAGRPTQPGRRRRARPSGRPDGVLVRDASSVRRSRWCGHGAGGPLPAAEEPSRLVERWPLPPLASSTLDPADGEGAPRHDPATGRCAPTTRSSWRTWAGDRRGPPWGSSRPGSPPGGARGGAGRAAVCARPAGEFGALLRGPCSTAAAGCREGRRWPGWVDESVAFLSSCGVDRIVPRPRTRTGRGGAAARAGGPRQRRRAVRQWVIEDAFAAAGPCGTGRGHADVNDVAPYEESSCASSTARTPPLPASGAGGRSILAEAVRPEDRAFAAALMAIDVDADAAPCPTASTWRPIPRSARALREPGPRPPDDADRDRRPRSCRSGCSARSRPRAAGGGPRSRHGRRGLDPVREPTRTDAGRPLPVDDPPRGRFAVAAAAAHGQVRVRRCWQCGRSSATTSPTTHVPPSSSDARLSSICSRALPTGPSAAAMPWHAAGMPPTVTARRALDPDRLFPTEPRHGRSRGRCTRSRDLPLLCRTATSRRPCLASDDPFRETRRSCSSPRTTTSRGCCLPGRPLEALGVPRRDGGPVERDRRGSGDALRAWHLFRGTPSRLWLEQELRTSSAWRRARRRNRGRLYDASPRPLATPRLQPRALYQRFRLGGPRDDRLAHSSSSRTTPAARRPMAGRSCRPSGPTRLSHGRPADWPRALRGSASCRCGPLSYAVFSPP